MTRVIHNKFVDFYFIKFPIIFPILYFSCLTLFPGYENFIILFTLIFLAEPHFGATWPFMINALNKNKFSNEKGFYVYLPLLIIILSLILFIYFKLLLFLIFFLANFYHVTRQSSGISKIFMEKNNDIEASFHINLIYFFGLFFFIIGFLRFQLPILDNNYIVILNISVLVLMLVTVALYIYSFGIKNIFLLLTGILIFYPVCFVNSAIHAIIMGVTMHYSQYIFITYKINMRRIKELKNDKKAIKSSISFISIIFLYGLFMGIFSVFDKFTNTEAGYLIIIPLIGQLLHFYYDGLLWKFSDPHNRSVTLKYI